MPSAKAAVLRQTGAPMTIETVEVGPLAAGDVLVRVRAASLCHTDLEAIEGSLPVALPAVLGHEAAGEVVEDRPGRQRSETWRSGRAVVESALRRVLLLRTRAADPVPAVPRQRAEGVSFRRQAAAVLRGRAACIS